MSLNKLYYLNVGPGGTFAPSGNQEFDSTTGDVDNLMAHLKSKDQKKLVLYVHGGLVNQNSGMDSATRITHLINSTTTFHPISLVWETGFMETLTSNLTEVYKTKLFKKLVKKAIKIAGKKLGIDLDVDGLKRGAGRLNEEELDRQLRQIEPFKDISVDVGSRSLIESQPDARMLADLDEEVSDAINQDDELLRLIESEKDAQEKSLLDLDKLSPSADARARGIISGAAVIKAVVAVIFRVIKRHLKKRDHGFYPTIIEELLREIYVGEVGSWIWGQMKEKAEEMWKPDGPATANLERHVGTYLLDKLEEYSESSGPITLDVVGHSAGAIVISHLVATLEKRKSGIKIRNINFLAPACLCALFDKLVISNRSRFSFLRIFTMSDSYEKRDRMLSIVYPRSLLYFISGLLEDRETGGDAYLLGLERHISGWEVYRDEALLARIKEYLDSVPNTTVFAITADDSPEGLRCIAARHGDFDNDSEATFTSLAYLINQ